jgi:hypothetical protein
MNTLKRATIVTLVAGSALIMATTAAMAAPAVTADETGQVSQSGVQGTSVESDRNSGEEGQIGVQGTSVENDRNSGEEGQHGDQTTAGDGANSQSGDQTTANDGANGQSGENK